MRWLRKAILRAAGILSLHDEEKIFAKQTKTLGAIGVHLGSAAFDWIAFITTFKAVVIEGLEVVFIVIAVGATGGMLIPASLGAVGAAILVVLLGIVLHRPLAGVPEKHSEVLGRGTPFCIWCILDRRGASLAMAGRRLGDSRACCRVLEFC